MSWLIPVLNLKTMIEIIERISLDKFLINRYLFFKYLTMWR